MRFILTLTPLIIAFLLSSCGPGISGSDDRDNRISGEILSTKGLIFYASMDEKYGAISDYVLTAIGAPQGVLEYNRPGAQMDENTKSSAIHFDNATSCFRFGQIPALKLKPPFTLMALVNMDFNPGTEVSILSSYAFAEQEWSLQINSGPNVRFEWSDNGTTPYSLGGPTLGTGIWELVTVAVDFSGNARFFLNSTDFGVSGVVSPPIYKSTAPVSVNLGCQDGTLGFGGESNFFNGSIDAVAVFKRALTHGEVMRIDQARYN